MIAGIGNDVVDMRRLARVLARFPKRFPRYILTATEQRQLPAAVLPFLAGRWAAKEALGKALGCGVRTPLGFRQVEVENDSEGKPRFVFTPAAADFLRQRRVGRCHLSISHDGDYAAAMVVVEEKARP